MARGMNKIKTSKLERQLMRMPNDLKAPLKAATLKGAEVVARQAQANVPVRTGKLKRSIEAVQWPKELGARVIVDEFYGIFVEHGTVKKNPQPFLFPAFKAKRKKVVRIIKRAVNKTLKQAARR